MPKEGNYFPRSGTKHQKAGTQRQLEAMTLLPDLGCMVWERGYDI